MIPSSKNILSIVKSINYCFKKIQKLTVNLLSKMKDIDFYNKDIATKIRKVGFILKIIFNTKRFFFFK